MERTSHGNTTVLACIAITEHIYITINHIQNKCLHDMYCVCVLCIYKIHTCMYKFKGEDNYIDIKNNIFKIYTVYLYIHNKYAQYTHTFIM